MRKKEIQTERILWIDGLKAVCGFYICFLHYLLAFLPIGFVGWGSGVPNADKKQFFLDHLPFSIFVNSSFALYVFFGLIAFLPAWRYFKNQDSRFIWHQIVSRYIRLVIPVAGCTLLSYVFWKLNLNGNIRLASLTGSNWIAFVEQELYTGPVSFLNALYSGFINVFITENGRYCSILWCIYIIFIGSYLSYAFILLIRRFRFRWLLYAGGVFFVAFFPYYAAFLAGIAVADAVTSGFRIKWPVLWIMIGLAIGGVPSVFVPFGLSRALSYALGVLFLLAGCCGSVQIQSFLSRPFWVQWGKLSFSLILTHFIVLQSVSAGLFIFLASQGLPFSLNILVTFLVSVPFLYFLTIVFYEVFEKYLFQWVKKRVR